MQRRISECADNLSRICEQSNITFILSCRVGVDGYNAVFGDYVMGELGDNFFLTGGVPF